MALTSCKLDELLCLLPREVHEKTVEIYNTIPGSLLKFIGPKPITKKAERSEHQLMTEKSMETDDNEYQNNPIQDSSYSNHRNIYHHENDEANRTYLTEPMHETKQDYMGHKTGIKNNKDSNYLRIHLENSIRKMFDDRLITEIDPNTLAYEISTKCLEQCPEWGKQCKNSSTIIQFNKIFISENDSTKMNILVYVYAHLKCEFDTLVFGLRNRNQYKTSYDLAIELNGISINLMKLIEFCQLVKENSVHDAIEKIEAKTQLTWNDL
ncbi:unnamed protein product [Rotaria sp. Silwood2]|nr:unnamed protein product [Rotaria sp. Silwood2]CAF3093387.1 unnamed protein product [Rotaria sp. Silwood2]CAF3262812.1 unnamed protein product [Rotaria sp. Silwood2]CAF4398746.1 unnamed protein product [Rotaria sp. Silwood2]CAF4442267.1 unnamed protein product [Rotaria sp. Silwood2]